MLVQFARFSVFSRDIRVFRKLFRDNLCDFDIGVVFDAVLSDVLFHNSYSFRVTKFLVNTSIFGTLGICFDRLGTMP